MNRKMENHFLCVEVSDRGAELMRIVRKDTGAEILWNGDPTLLGLPFPDPFSKCRKYLAEKNEDQRERIPDPPAWICQRKRIYLRRRVCRKAALSAGI